MRTELRILRRTAAVRAINGGCSYSYRFPSIINIGKAPTPLAQMLSPIVVRTETTAKRTSVSAIAALLSDVSIHTRSWAWNLIQLCDYGDVFQHFLVLIRNSNTVLSFCRTAATAL